MVLNTARRAAERESRDGPRSAQPRQIFSDAKRSRDVFSAIRAALRSAFGRSVEIDAPSGARLLGPHAGEVQGRARGRRPLETGIGAESRHVGRTRRHGPIRPGAVGEGPSRMVGRVPGLGPHAGEEQGRAWSRRPLEAGIGMQARQVRRRRRPGVIRPRPVRARPDGMRPSGVRTRRGKSGAGGRRNVPRGRGSGGQQRRAQQKTAACLFQDSFHDSFREFVGLFRQRVSSYAPRPEEAIGGAAGTRHAKREKKYKK